MITITANTCIFEAGFQVDDGKQDYKIGSGTFHQHSNYAA